MAHFTSTPPRSVAGQRIADAVFYMLRFARAGRMLPREYSPPQQTYYYHFRKLRRSSALQSWHDQLR